MISPLDLDWDELLVYHQLYLKADFKTGITEYTDRQIEHSLREAKIGRTRIKSIINKFKQHGIFIEISKGIRGKKSKPAVGKLVKISEIEQSLIEPNVNLKRTLEGVDNRVINNSCKPNTTPIQPLFDPLIKEKGIKNNINSASSESLWKLYPNKKGKVRAMKKIPKLLEDYGFEKLEKCISRYKAEVETERVNGFKNKSYQNGDTFFNGSYVDYLDENYLDKYTPNYKQENIEKENVKIEKIGDYEYESF
ncbi:hypothetical protein [Metaclostridioides mangenotii]|uniref:Helix-turn-helix domain-containing protein n=1 Tax=Metaclostridioides mangenotii TaxID=1540 RepID=A0ABS4E7X6_9FIRM|nr:hypothetical protein [Clostridioides mangenotii]MBP1854029.1 hypothetical protein [Clostridioides mangenotii]